MIAPEAVEKLLQNPVVKVIAGAGFLLLINGVLSSILFNLVDGLDLWDSLFRSAVWRISWITLLSMAMTIGVWLTLSTTRTYEQAFWLIVGGVFVAWVLVVVPVGTYLPNALQALLSLVANLVRGTAVLLAFVTLDRAVPRMSPTTSASAPTAIHPQAVQPQAAQPQATATQAAGWYPDPQGEADWRWWDGAGWTDNTN